MFIPDGPLVEQYQDDLQGFNTVIMGRNTYEFGYKFGLEPCKPAYPHMQHYIFSKSLKFKNPDNNVVVVDRDPKFLEDLKNKSGTDIYLCGGGAFVGWLLDLELIDILKIKLNPILLGAGIPLFGNSVKSLQLDLIERKEFESGSMIITYEIWYKKKAKKTK